MLVIAYKNKEFSKWAKKEGLSDALLLAALDEVGHGLVEADLGGNVFKKRVSLGHGKSGGARTLLAYKKDDRAFFIFGFAKNARANIKDNELRSLKLYAKILLSYNEKDLTKAIKEKALIQVEANDG
ncbi:MAG: type II toxin-antitoxin system RelE/ParE family toxin [Proteobacteria bacterium]|nr:type II toxin-antitoxin system RelE/ParE family toxin [Pseudomonadota bacterium]MDA1292048.1 type II toxin-antitoxin system RelE/ParE family toxin [Pseudomonadota bacterium]